MGGGLSLVFVVRSGGAAAQPKEAQQRKRQQGQRRGYGDSADGLRCCAFARCLLEAERAECQVAACDFQKAEICLFGFTVEQGKTNETGCAIEAKRTKKSVLPSLVLKISS